jgi:hypothetical protein
MPCPRPLSGASRDTDETFFFFFFLNRKSVVEGKGVGVSVDFGGCVYIKKKKINKNI